MNAPLDRESLSAADEASCGDARYVYGVVAWPFGAEMDAPVYFLPCRDLAAIVRRVSLSEFGPDALEQNLRDAGWLQAAVLDHQQVLDRALQQGRGSSRRGTPLPMRFGTIYRSEAGVRQALAEQYVRLAAALARLAGKCEWGVKAYCDRASLAQIIEDPGREIGLIGEHVRSLRAGMAGLSQGAAYFMKKKLETVLDEAVEACEDETARRSHARLAACAAEAALSSSLERPAAGQDETLVLNAAYLVANERLEDFRAELGRLENETSPLGFRYRLTGPWAPYNFVGEPDAQNPKGSKDQTPKAAFEL